MKDLITTIRLPTDKETVYSWEEFGMRSIQAIPFAILMALYLVLAPADSHAKSAVAPEAWVQGCRIDPELCVPRCQRHAKFCAETINDYLTAKIKGQFRFLGWPFFPNVGPMHSNIQTPMHGAYVTIYVNDIAGIYLDSVLKQGPAVGTVDFPNGSLIVKQNFVLASQGPQTKPWLTVMWKLDG